MIDPSGSVDSILVSSTRQKTHYRPHPQVELPTPTLRNLSEHGAAGRTGPFVRGDEATIDRDARALPEEWWAVFLDLGRL